MQAAETKATSHSDQGHQEGREEVKRIIADIQRERIKQIAKWGVQDHASLIPILLARAGGCSPERMCEEYEIPSETRAKFLCRNSNPDTWAHIAIEELAEAVSCLDDEAAMREELVQLAAVCVAWIEAIDRRALKSAKNGGFPARTRPRKGRNDRQTTDPRVDILLSLRSQALKCSPKKGTK